MSEGKENKIPEFEPPQACVSRVIKPILPENILLTKDARVAFARAAGIFIFYLTHCSNEYSKDAKRQTILASDVMNALRYIFQFLVFLSFDSWFKRELDFEDFAGPLEEFLEGLLFLHNLPSKAFISRFILQLQPIDAKMKQRKELQKKEENS